MRLALVLSLILTNLLHSIRASPITSSEDDDGFTLVGSRKGKNGASGMAPKQVDHAPKARRTSTFMNQTAAAVPAHNDDDSGSTSSGTTTSSSSSKGSGTDPYNPFGNQSSQSDSDWNAFDATTQEISGYNSRVFRQVGKDRKYVVMNHKYFRGHTKFDYEIMGNTVVPKYKLSIQNKKVLDLVQIAVLGFIDNEEYHPSSTQRKLSCVAPSTLHLELEDGTERAMHWFHDFYQNPNPNAGRRAYYMFDTMGVRLDSRGYLVLPPHPTIAGREMPTCAAYMRNRYRE